jgi:hypothetical protein
MRTLLAFITLCAVVAKFGSYGAAYYVEQRVFEELRKTGNSVSMGEFDFSLC